MESDETKLARQEERVEALLQALENALKLALREAELKSADMEQGLRAQLLTERGRMDRLEQAAGIMGMRKPEDQAPPQTCRCSDPDWKRGVGEMIGDLVLRVGRLEKKGGA